MSVHNVSSSMFAAMAFNHRSSDSIRGNIRAFKAECGLHSAAVSMTVRAVIAGFLLFHAFPVPATAQQPSGIEDRRPPSPTAASLGSYGDVPVSLFTGQPTISIPIATVDGATFGVPITLHYNASSVKPNSAPSQVGWGWSLSAGAVITRMVRGLPDDSEFGYLETGHTINDDVWEAAMYETEKTYTASSPIADYLEQVNLQMADPEPDEFYFNLGEYSGRFFFDHDQNIQIASKTNLKIERGNVAPISVSVFGSVEMVHMITEWTITTPEGMIYTFNEPEYRKTLLYRQNTTETPCENNCITPTAWYLTSIATPHGETITLEYQSYNTTETWEDVFPTELEYLYWAQVNPNIGCSELAGTGDRKITSQTIAQYSKPRLISISSDSRVAKFNSTPRPSHLMRSGEDMLNSVYLYEVSLDGSETLVSRAYLDYGLEASFLHAYGNRLMLTSVTHVPIDQTEITGPESLTYRMEYYDTGKVLPSKTSSFSVDHWGYFNGRVNSSGLPPVRYRVHTGPDAWKEVGGADREPDEVASRHGVLQRIHYPTGGSTTLVYEQHDYAYTMSTSTGPSGTIRVDSTVYVFDEIVDPPDYGEVCVNDYANINVAPGNEVTITAHVRYGFEMCLPGDTSEHCGDNQLVPSCGQSGGTAPCAHIRVWDPLETTNPVMNIHSAMIGVDENHVAASFAGTGRQDPYSVSVQICSEWDHDRPFGARIDVRTSTFVAAGSAPGLPAGLPAGGVRIKEVRSSSGTGEPDVVTSYSYRMPENEHGIRVSTGILDEMPVYAHWGGVGDEGVAWCLWAYRQSAPVFPLGGFGGSPVFYSMVTVEREGAGKEVHDFYINRETFEEPVATPIWLGSVRSLWAHTARTRGDQRWGAPTRQRAFAEDGTLLRTTTEDYEGGDVGPVGFNAARAIAVRTARFNDMYDWTIFHHSRYQDVSEWWRRVVSTTRIYE